MKGIPFLADAAELILAHHERRNGSGYPRGLRGDNIPMSARIFAVADRFDAMTSDRPYRLALPLRTAQNVIYAGSGELFYPEVVDAFFGIGVDTRRLISADAQTASIHTIICRKVRLKRQLRRSHPRSRSWSRSPVERKTTMPTAAIGRALTASKGANGFCGRPRLLSLCF